MDNAIFLPRAYTRRAITNYPAFPSSACNVPSFELIARTEPQGRERKRSEINFRMTVEGFDTSSIGRSIRPIASPRSVRLGDQALLSADRTMRETHALIRESIIVRCSDAAPRTTVIDTAIIKAPPGKGCPRCGGVVFAAEQVLARGSEWHRKCFKCHDCTKTLDSIIACDGPDRDVYCKTCYGKKWGPHGYGFACGSGFLQTDGLT